MRSAKRGGIGLLALFAAATALSYGAYRRDLAAARARLAGVSNLAATPRGPIEYATTGTGPPVLIVHGAGGGFDQGLAFGGALAACGFRVIAMSRFGYLRTPLPADASATAQADAHARLLDALEIERAAVVGASAGAPSALQLAIRHPGRTVALVLLVPATFVPRPGGGPSLHAPAATQRLFASALRSDFLFWAIRRAMPKLMIRGLLASPPELVARADDAERARAAGILDAIMPVSERRLGMLNDAKVTSHLERYPLERIVAPTLAISAADDLFGTYDAARYTAEQIPGARFLGYTEGGHVFVGRQAEIIGAIDEFLRSAGAEAALGQARATDGR
jgi:2-hydroxy-6-oxonona-2,4-dienedioate hydrolase